MERTSLIFTGIAALFLMTMYDFYGAFLMGFIMLVTPLLGVAISFGAKYHLKVEIHSPAKGQRQEKLEIPVTVHSPFLSFLPWSISFEKEGRNVAYNKNRRILRWIPEHTGRMTLPALSLTWQDPFHLFRHHHHETLPPIIVFPSRIGAEERIWSLLTAQKEEEIEHFGATEYHPGDNIHLMNWKVSARKDAWYVRDSAPLHEVSMALAADYATDETDRDILCDALFSLGLSLLRHHRPFLFLWRKEIGCPVAENITTETEWESALTSFLSFGGDNALQAPPIAPDLPLLYLTDKSAPYVPTSLHPRLWSTDRNAHEAELAGITAFKQAIGGER